MIYVELFGVSILIIINDPFLRLIWKIYEVIVLLGVLLKYYGVMHQVKNVF